ncbi:MAG: hypothetical protein JW776_14425 [Candidatus Lokiarchaeota archaeon]|nr:hypothetical protein [Candidatus Lokiarchaeota archaeon]
MGEKEIYIKLGTAFILIGIFGLIRLITYFGSFMGGQLIQFENIIVYNIFHISALITPILVLIPGIFLLVQVKKLALQNDISTYERCFLEDYFKQYLIGVIILFLGEIGFILPGYIWLIGFLHFIGFGISLFLFFLSDIIFLSTWNMVNALIEHHDLPRQNGRILKVVKIGLKIDISKFLLILGILLLILLFNFILIDPLFIFRFYLIQILGNILIFLWFIAPIIISIGEILLGKRLRELSGEMRILHEKITSLNQEELEKLPEILKKSCPNCNMTISADTTVCPFCRKQV